MKYIAGYLLLSLGGKKEISAKDLSEFLKSNDCQVNEEQVKAVCDALHGKALHELCANGMGKLASFSTNSSASTSEKEEKKAPVKEEKKKEEKKKVEEAVVEEDADIGGLFD
ncbi:unnamed protein product [Rotaria magnacalcarata]|uniref:Large ribosomal subunit protein P2 n=1 Tax=Rotaria magnacalcarata TaxID=392030 RepID=A0A816R6A5_9BILA|nr:unnamed protein product [Rotaria magnacalcarata]